MAPYAIKSVIALCEKLLCDFLHCYADCERMYKSIVLVLFLINFVTGLGLGPRCLLHMNQCEYPICPCNFLLSAFEIGFNIFEGKCRMI